jgi:hypothetical protein
MYKILPMAKNKKPKSRSREMTVREMARLGGLAAQKRRTPERRREIMRQAVLARWARWHLNRAAALVAEAEKAVAA